MCNYYPWQTREHSPSPNNGLFNISRDPKMYIVMTIYEPSNTWCPNCIHSINIPLDTPLNEDMHGVSDGGRNIVQNYDAWDPKCTLFQCH